MQTVIRQSLFIKNAPSVNLVVLKLNLVSKYHIIYIYLDISRKYKYQEQTFNNILTKLGKKLKIICRFCEGVIILLMPTFNRKAIYFWLSTKFLGSKFAWGQTLFYDIVPLKKNIYRRCSCKEYVVLDLSVSVYSIIAKLQCYIYFKLPNMH